MDARPQVPEDVTDEVAALFRPRQPDWATMSVGALLVATAKELLSTPYVLGGGHGPLVWKPPVLDCSGLVRTVFWKVSGKDLLNGTSETQWASLLGGVVPTSELLLPGDAIFFVGDPIDPPPGHVGYVVTYAGNGTGTYISAYDTALGTVIEPFDRNGTGWGEVIGVLRVANAIQIALTPPPPPPSIPLVDQFIAKNPYDGGDYLCSWSTRRAVGIPSPAVEAQLTSYGIKRDDALLATAGLTDGKGHTGYFVPEVWAAAKPS